MAARSARSKISNDSGRIQVSAIMDSGTAESVAQIGRECVADRRSSRPPLVAFHHGSAFGRPRLLHGRIACSPCLHCQSRRVLISGFSTVVEQYCLATGAQHDVIMRASPRLHEQRTCQSVSTQHLDMARELLNLLDEALAETLHFWRNMRDGKGPPAPHYCGWRW